jgi:ubiquinone biosynthesis monooxygenase Coq7
MSIDTTDPKPVNGPDRLPGDPSKEEYVERLIRVDHAGEYGAVRIYEGQLAILGKKPSGPIVQHMLEQEKAHLATFDKLINERRVRPTALMPLWHVAGFALGAATAMMGERAAMACTVGVEEAIDEHYQSQIEALEPYSDEANLRETCVKFRKEELEHRDTGLDHGAKQVPGYEVLTGAIKAGSKLAIWLSKRI